MVVNFDHHEKLDICSLPLEGTKLIRSMRISDARGYFAETYVGPDFATAGIDHEFIQDNESRHMLLVSSAGCTSRCRRSLKPSLFGCCGDKSSTLSSILSQTLSLSETLQASCAVPAPPGLHRTSFARRKPRYNLA